VFLDTTFSRGANSKPIAHSNADKIGPRIHIVDQSENSGTVMDTGKQLPLFLPGQIEVKLHQNEIQPLGRSVVLAVLDFQGRFHS
jgi:hypothetical protein